MDVQLQLLGMPADQPYQCHDLLTDARYLWQGYHNTVKLDPGESAGPRVRRPPAGADGARLRLLRLGKLNRR